jgi:SAM-dependent methyltransferase
MADRDESSQVNAAAYDADTLRFYADEAPVYTASGPQGSSRHLSSFLDRLQPRSRILELGCGGGRDSELMIRRGFVVVPTDGSAEIARKAEERIRTPVRVMRFDELCALEEYDAVWAHASLLHVPRSGLTAVLRLIWRALRPGGLHCASFKGGGEEGRDRFGRYFNYLDLPELLVIYDASGAWEVVTTDQYMGGGYGRSEGPWAAVTLRKVG